MTFIFTKSAGFSCLLFFPIFFPSTKIFDIAVSRNTICMLGTGLGKTFIAVMVVKEMLSRHPGTKGVIICPTAFLVDQQGDVFRSNSPYQVGICHGGRKDSHDWNHEKWQREWAKKGVFVLTPQVLVNALNHAYISLDSVSVLVMDECHHVSSGDHPMGQLMQRVCEMDVLPRVLGLTASPLVSSPKDLKVCLIVQFFCSNSYKQQKRLKLSRWKERWEARK
jgi:endoribonuclease Dicer